MAIKEEENSTSGSEGNLKILNGNEGSHTNYNGFEEQEYSILPVMSELSFVPCDHALGLWIAGTWASSVVGELPWRSSGRAAAVASTPGSRAQAATESRFLGLRHKTKQADGV